MLTSTSDYSDTRALADAMGLSSASDTLSLTLSATQWGILGGYMLQFSVAQGQSIISKGDQDRSVYLLESGSCSVHSEDASGKIRLVLVGAGSVIGEGSFFGHMPRHANVQAAGPAVLWRISPARFTELCNRQPAIALELALALAAVMAKRMRNRARRIAIT